MIPHVFCSDEQNRTANNPTSKVGNLSHLDRIAMYFVLVDGLEPPCPNGTGIIYCGCEWIRTI
jgi:hypothetical protein